MAVASDPTQWQDGLGDTPPLQWEYVDTDSRWWWIAGDDNADPITYIGAGPLPATLELDWEIVVSPVSGNIILRHIQDGVPTLEILGGSGTGTLTITIADPDASFAFEVYAENDPGEGLYSATVAILGPAPVEEPVIETCRELGRATRAYVSAYDRARVQQCRLYRFERRCLVANFNGAFAPARTIASATWRIDAPQIGVISDAQISENGRETMVMFASQLGGWANVRVDATLDNGEIYSQVFRVNVREASAYFDDPAIVVGPYSLSVSV